MGSPFRPSSAPDEVRANRLGGSDRTHIGGEGVARSLQPVGTQNYNPERRLPNNAPTLRRPTIHFAATGTSQQPDTAPSSSRGPRRHQIYVIACNGRIKIGYSKQLRKRFIAHKTELGDYEIVAIADGDRRRERQLHTAVFHHNIHGEWFADLPEVRDTISRTLKEFAEADTPLAPVPIVNSWFRDACRTALGKDAGAQLHHITGYPERSCYYYAAGETPPPTDFLRKVLHSPYGAPFFLALMDGCPSRWWHELALRVAPWIDQ